MNLFCFSLEGSMDSLYEVVRRDSKEASLYTVPSRSTSRPTSHTCSRSHSPALLLEGGITQRRESNRSTSMDISQIQRANSKKKKKRNVTRSISDNDVLDKACCDRSSLWLSANPSEDLVHTKNHQNEDVLKPNVRRKPQAKGGREQAGAKKKEKAALQNGKATSPERPNSRQRDLIVHTSDGAAPQDAAKRKQKTRKKAGGKNEKEGTKKKQCSTARHPPVPTPPAPTPVEGLYLNVVQEQARRTSNPDQASITIAVQASWTMPDQTSRTIAEQASRTMPDQASRTTIDKNKRTIPEQARSTIPGRTPSLLAQKSNTHRHLELDSNLSALDLRTGPAGSSSSIHQQRWSNPAAGLANSIPSWDSSSHHTCRRPITEYRGYAHDFPLPRGTNQELETGSLKRNPSSRTIPRRSITDVDLSDPNRSTSLGKFDSARHQPSPSKLEEDGATMGGEGAKSANLMGKKMKAISQTMRRKMCKKHSKSYSEETEEEMEGGGEGEVEGENPTPAGKEKTSNSMESLNSGQSSSSGVASVSDGGGNRDSLRLEEDGSYHGQFCGRARVHTDFVPSPYDTDSLKLKAGDIISIISKPPMGIWTGMLNNKVGNFKFIYVDVIEKEEEKEKKEEAPKIRPQKLCRRPRPKTLLELLERLHLEEYASALLLNGYQTVDDLRHLQEKHLIELNVTDPDHRQKLLAAAVYHYIEGEEGTGEKEESKTSLEVGPEEEEEGDCARDSGCFIPADCPDNSKEDVDSQAAHS